MGKMMIYAYLPRLFRSVKEQLVVGGNYETNGSGKFADMDQAALAKLRALGFNCIWAIGVIRHASRCDFPNEQIEADPAPTVKGEAGSPYAVTDYFDVAPYLAEDAAHRMDEFDALTERCHRAGMKLIIDFVPNHVARTYHSLSHEDFGLHDDRSVSFARDNHFYWLPGEQLVLHGTPDYVEQPARATGNDRFTTAIGPNDWYETVKLNYGIDYTKQPREHHFEPIPATWHAMKEVLLFWAKRGVDGFRCDMAEMVPVAFWRWVIPQIKKERDILFIAEIYQTALYREFVQAGFDYLYDKVGLYDTLMAVSKGNCPAGALAAAIEAQSGIRANMLYFLENHDEVRLAAPQGLGSASAALPALAVALYAGGNPYMHYFAQALSDRADRPSGYSGGEGRTSIYDFTRIPSLSDWIKGKYTTQYLGAEERYTLERYTAMLRHAAHREVVSSGQYYYLPPDTYRVEAGNANGLFLFLRHNATEVLLTVANFAAEPASLSLRWPMHFLDLLGVGEGERVALPIDLRHDTTLPYASISAFAPFRVAVQGHDFALLHFLLQ